LLNRQEAAEALGMSLRHFQRHAQPFIPCVYSGKLRLYRPADLERWAEQEAADTNPSRHGSTRPAPRSRRTPGTRRQVAGAR